MITFFTIPKAFEGSIGMAQKNSIKSWLTLLPKPEIILFGDDPGVDKMANELGIRHVKDIKKNKFGTPLLGWVFNEAKKIAKNDVLVFINTDIILNQSFMTGVDFLNENKLESFLVSGQRVDLDLDQSIDFSKNDWSDNITKLSKEKGALHGFSGMDYFIFKKSFPITLPEFAVGVSGWDSWLVFKTKSLKIPFIDATEVITIIHQNHSPRHKNKSFYDEQKEENLKLAGGSSNMMTLREADFILTKNGLAAPKFSRFVFSRLALFYPWRLLLFTKRQTIDRFLGRSS